MALQEEVKFEGSPHRGEMVINTVLLIFPFPLVWLPFFTGALVRQVFTRYRFTSRRITVEGGWRGKNRTDVIYREVAQIKAVPDTLFGSMLGYGTLLIVLRDGARLELKAVPKFREIGEFVEEKINFYSQKDKRP